MTAERTPDTRERLAAALRGVSLTQYTEYEALADAIIAADPALFAPDPATVALRDTLQRVGREMVRAGLTDTVAYGLVAAALSRGTGGAEDVEPPTPSVWKDQPVSRWEP